MVALLTPSIVRFLPTTADVGTNISPTMITLTVAFLTPVCNSLHGTCFFPHLELIEPFCLTQIVPVMQNESVLVPS